MLLIKDSSKIIGGANENTLVYCLIFNREGAEMIEAE
jgi:hypothetical protein